MGLLVVLRRFGGGILLRFGIGEVHDVHRHRPSGSIHGDPKGIHLLPFQSPGVPVASVATRRRA